jgi:hypothetical protein
MNELTKKLSEIVKNKLTDKDISADIAIDSITEFYLQHKTQNITNIPDNDMLLFQYGTYDPNGQGGIFELNFTRQIIDPDDDDFFQIGLTLYFRSEDIEEIESFNLWSIERLSINEWTKSVKDTDGFKRANYAKPYHYSIELNKT